MNDNNNNKTLKPYLINAFYTWTIDNKTTPLIEVVYDTYNVLPNSVKNDMSVILNIHPDATRNMLLGKSYLQFEALFNGEDFNVCITYESIQKIFNKENGYGLEFTLDPNQLKTEYLGKKTTKTIIKRKNLQLIKFNKTN
ncbi:hypothetical protein GW796_09970 [archaeon]|nr:hypothetical protein [archaeon]